MPKFIDITSMKFGRLLVVSRAKNKGKLTHWNCVCDCGEKTIVNGPCLKNGHTKSCGCLKSEINRNRMKDKGNPMWKGDEVKYAGMHVWVNRNKPKTDFCEKCEIVEPYDLANISGGYKRDINDYEWLCRRCHMLSDGRLKKLKKRIEKYNTNRRGLKCCEGHE